MKLIYLIFNLLIINCVNCINLNEFFPFGAQDITIKPGDESSSAELPLTVPIKFFDTVYRSIFVNVNGILSFLTEIPVFRNAQFPLTYPVIAPFYSDIDTTTSGNVYYRETMSIELLRRATTIINQHFNNSQNFRAESLFIATWAKVGYFRQKNDKKNTFQVVIASDQTSSYAFFLYADGEIQWLQSDGKTPTVPDARPQAGFLSGGNRMYLLPFSGSNQVEKYDRMSNVNEPGLWVFKIGYIQHNETIKIPDLNLNNQISSETCEKTLLPCPQNSKCINYETGICCRCDNGFYGDGRECIRSDKAQTLVGTLNIALKNVNNNNLINRPTSYYIHAYIDTKDGKTYTALSRLPANIGSDVLSLFTIGDLIGWLFAKPTNTLNGISITGGRFNRTTAVTFQDSNHQVEIIENYFGFDAFGHLKLNLNIRGNLPSIPFLAKVELNDFNKVYTRTSKNTFNSQSINELKINDNEKLKVKIDEKINFHECNALPENEIEKSLKLDVTRTLITYENTDQIVRFAASYAISSLSDNNICLIEQIKCGEHSSCVSLGNQFSCLCENGYQRLLNASSELADCVDIDECKTNRCDPNADCVNLIGSYSCQCRYGYIDDGGVCKRQLTCEDLACDRNANCIQKERTMPFCQCKAGYEGDGFDCMELGDYEPINSECEVKCHKDGRCIKNEQTNEHYCACNPGFIGNGYQCIRDPNSKCNIMNNCHEHAKCVYDSRIGSHECQCMAGYHGDGYSCTMIKQEHDCTVDEKCSPDARCLFNPSTNKHECKCNENFHGNGIICRAIHECMAHEQCQANAHCVYDLSSKSNKCHCNSGYFMSENKSCKKGFNDECDYCHQEATCKYDIISQKNQCECKSGWFGDGRQCQRQSYHSCNTINNCDPQADCLLVNNGYNCKCRQGFKGDGLFCAPIKNCLEDYQLCDPNADCTFLDHLNDYGCHCRVGFTGNGLQCRELPRVLKDYIVFAQGMSLLQMPLEQTNDNKGKLLITKNFQIPVGLDVDCVDGNIYWSDVFHHSIYRSKYNGTQIDEVIREELESPEGISVDWISRNIYWTDSVKDIIQVASLDGKYIKTLIEDDLVDPRGIVAHPGIGKLFWTDWNRMNPKIEISNLDGSGRAILVNNDLSLPNMLAIDYRYNDICWTDAGLKRIECVDIYGSNRKVIIQAEYPFDLTIANGDIFWTDWNSKKIGKINKNGGKAQDIEIPLGGNGRLYGIVTVPEQCPRMSNPCANNNGGCKYLCLPNGRNGRSCVCPDIPEEKRDECKKEETG